MINIICGIIDLLFCLISFIFGITNISTDPIWVTCVNIFAAGFCFCGSISCFLVYMLSKRGYKE